MMRAVIYARFSCSKQREASIEDQIRVCEEWCQREGYEVVATYCDHAVSGRTDDRPEFQRMISNAGESDIVLVYMMDRFSRDIYDAPIYKKRLREKGVKVVSATEPMPDTPEAILIESIYEAMAAMESAHTSRRVKRGMEGNAMKAMHNGASLFGYDFADDGRYVVNEDEALIVRECFARKISGESVHSIARSLHDRGVRGRRGKLASYGMVYNMLRNEKYAGVYKWGDVRIEDGMPAIISKEEFAMAQAARPKKERASEAWGEFPLSSKGVCGGCGYNLVGTSGRGRRGTKYEYYSCSQRCGAKPIRADLLDAAVVSAIRGVLSDREEALRIAGIVEAHVNGDDSKRRMKDAEKRKADAENGISRVLDAIAEGLDMKHAQPKIEELESQKEAAERELRMCKPGFDAEDFADFLQFGSTLDDAAILKAFVYQVVVGEDSIIVTLNYDRKGEPARLEVPRVLTDSLWWAKLKTPITLSYANGLVLLKFPR